MYYNHLTPASIQELQTLVNQEGMALLKQINREAKKHQKADQGKADAKHRINLGLFFYHKLQDKQQSNED